MNCKIQKEQWYRGALLSRGFIKLKEDFGLDDITVSKASLSLNFVSSETFVGSF